MHEYNFQNLKSYFKNSLFNEKRDNQIITKPGKNVLNMQEVFVCLGISLLYYLSTNFKSFYFNYCFFKMLFPSLKFQQNCLFIIYFFCITFKKTVTVYVILLN